MWKDVNNEPYLSIVCTFFPFAFRLDEDRLSKSSPVLARLFLQSIFISVDSRIREGHLPCDCLCDNGPLYSGQVSNVFGIRLSSLKRRT